MRLRRERSSVICRWEDRLLVVWAEDPGSRRRYALVPGGAIEQGETAVEAAARETIEETGYAVVVDEESELVREYPFEWGGKMFDCVTHFFRATLGDPLLDPVARL